MNCKKSYCNCPKEKQKEEYRQAKRKFPLIENPLEKWQCSDEEKQKEEYRQAKRKFPLIENPLEKWQCSDEEKKTCKYFEPYPPRMTKEQFEEKQKSALKDIPEEFQAAFSSLAWENGHWENGHSEGYEEVICHLHEIIGFFEEPIDKFRCRIIKESMKKILDI
jgi:hypothetical protein